MPNRGLVPDPPPSRAGAIALGILLAVAIGVTLWAVLAFALFALAGHPIEAREAFAVGIGASFLSASAN